MAFRSFQKFCFMAFTESKRVLWSGDFGFGNRKKSYRATYGEYGGWSMVLVAFLALNPVTTVASCDGTLSSCKIDEWFFHKSFRFWRFFSCKTLQYDQIVFFLDRLSLWNEFKMHKTTNMCPCQLWCGLWIWEQKLVPPSMSKDTYSRYFFRRKFKLIHSMPFRTFLASL